MRSRRLYSGLTKIFLKEAEDKNWQVYLATISNPMAQVGSFEDFIKKSGSNTQVVEMTQDQIDQEVQNATSILSGFAPPKHKI